MFRLALRQTEGLIGSIIHLLGLDLAGPDHSTLSRRAESLELPRPRPGSEPVHLLVDSTGLRLCGPGEWLVEKHGSRTRRSWRKLHIGVDADTGQILAAELTGPEIDDGSQIGPLLDQVGSPVASFTADGAFDRDDVYTEVTIRHPEAEVIVPPRSSAVPSQTAGTALTQRDGTSRSSPSTAEWLGRRPQGTTGALWSKPISRAGSASPARGCGRKRMGDRRPRWPSPSAC